jgi:hypothetical protein
MRQGIYISELHLLVQLVAAIILHRTVSAFAGKTSTFAFPPSGATVIVTDRVTPRWLRGRFLSCLARVLICFADTPPDAASDKADLIATAPAIARVDTPFPLVDTKVFGKPEKTTATTIIILARARMLLTDVDLASGIHGAVSSATASLTFALSGVVSR